MTEALGPDPAASIAVVGLSCRVPGAPDAGQFWANLRGGVESVTFFGDDELETDGIDPRDLADDRYVRAGAVLEGADLFDASFFGYSPREARLIDPQQRVFLEVAWAALEDAGCDAVRYPGSVGVFAGAGFNTYLLNNQFAGRAFLGSMNDLQTIVGGDKDHLATRLSYHLDLKGPSLTVQTACSTSLVAVTQACQSLLGYQCDVALAGGVTIRFPQRRGYLYESEGVRSPDGHCRAFDAHAQGTVGGHGAGVVVLKRLADAVADGDDIRAVVLGAAVNNDGATKVGYTAPSADAQSEVIRMAHVLSGVTADTISYVEAHGTGTLLGDPIEVAGLSRAFRASTDRTQFCGLGSVKTNIGHLDAAAGVAAFIKTVLALRHAQLPPSLNFSAPNPAIDFAASPFYVNAELRDWTSNGSPRRAGVSSFGMGGTNAHVVLEEAPPRPAAPPAVRPSHLLVLSAKTPAALERVERNLVSAVETAAHQDLADVAGTLQTGRRELRHRSVVVCRDGAGAAHAFRSAPAPIKRSVTDGRSRPVAFLLPGAGSQRVGMGRQLYGCEPVFRDTVDRCATVLEPELGLDIRAVMWSTSPSDDRLDDIALTLPALFTVDYALAQLWLSWGVRPDAMLGHSLGEYVAACLAGVFTLDDALRVVAGRARLMGQTPAGRMLAVPLPAAEVAARLDASVAVAAVNSPTLCVVSGPADPLRRLYDELAASSISCRWLRTSRALHSPLMEGAVDALRALVESVPRHRPRIPFISNVTGTWITDAQAQDPAYWGSHLRATVQFDAGVRTLLAEPARVLLEVGPGHTLTNLARAHRPGAPDAVMTASLSSGPAVEETEDEAVLRAVGDLWLYGVPVDWDALAGHRPTRRVPLPTYPFERQRHWIEPDYGTGAPATTGPATNMSGTTTAATSDARGAVGLFHRPVWKRSPLAPVVIAPAEPDLAPWLVFADDDSPYAAELIERLEATGRTVLSVQPGDSTDLDGDRLVLDVRDRESYRSLCAELVRRGGLPATVVHLWGATPRDASSAARLAPPADPTQLHGFFSVVFLAQALGELELGGDIDLIVVTTQVQDVTGEESLCPPKATVLGPCLVIPQESHRIRCRAIDLPLPAGDARDTDLVALLHDEVLRPSTDVTDAIVAFRGRVRWTQSIEPLALPRESSRSPLVMDHGAYVVIGGLGGIGLILANYLASAATVNLVLVGRTPLPPREQWDSWQAEHLSDDPTTRRLDAVRALEAKGADVLLVTADVADGEQMARVFDAAIERFGHVDGVIHCGGEQEVGLLQDLTPAQAGATMAAKVQGTAVLNAAVARLGLDWLVLCSSLSSVRPVGLADYSGANACVDAYAALIARTGPPTVAIGWDVWHGVGMAAGLETSGPQWVQDVALSATEGADAFSRLLGVGLPHVIVSARDVGSLRTATPSRRERAGDDADPTDGVAVPVPGADVGFEHGVGELWSSVLGVEVVGADDDFFDLGGHSLLATQLLNLVRQRYGVELTMRSFFDLPTPAGLAGLIDAATAPEVPADVAAEVFGDGQLTRAQLAESPPADRASLLRPYLRAQLSTALGIPVDELPADGRLDGFEPTDYQADLILALKRDLDVPLYSGELRSRPSIDALADLIAADLDRAATDPAREGAQELLPTASAGVRRLSSGERNPTAAFILSAPRSGSTLLRLMLAGHSRLFCPPELWLLGNERMDDWSRTRFADLSRDSLTQTFMDLEGWTAREAEAHVRDLVARNAPIQEVYREIQRSAAPRILVDKTPGYALSAKTLQRAEDLFDRPRYIHLTRHPAAVVESIVRNRFDRLMEVDGDPHFFGEQVWLRANRNVADVGVEVGDRCLRIRFEDLVTAPRAVLDAVCAFFEIPFEESMLTPYEDGRMITGPGDPNIFEHDGIDPARSRHVTTPIALAADGRAVAVELGYEV